MDNLNEFKIMLTAGITAVMGLLGWQGILVITWVVLMLADYISGSLAAKRAGDWNSRTARDGVMHKGGMMLVVLAAGLTDLVLGAAWDRLGLAFDWPFLLLALVLIWYCLTEVGSILENAGKMGTPIPKWFTAALDAGLHIVDGKGDQIADQIAQDKREQEGVEDG